MTGRRRDSATADECFSTSCGRCRRWRDSLRYQSLAIST